ncbi:Coenzyme F420 hydrogenase/dehydrogenase, beta subunit C-terminal domain [Candidatus Bathyarchaeota archaeon]|nr:Coenzyme F420 hydrogenase/dehydrogenase, beta subunit C-terminal domain [Candidatus Bathyarchaeota archaeon]
MAQQKKVFTDLVKDVVDTGLCVACGTCVAVCPVNVVDLEEGLPKLTGKCIECGLCYSNCPRAVFSVNEIDEAIHGRRREAKEGLTGVYREAYVAQTRRDDIHEKAQDGGVVTSLLAQFIEDGGDAIVVAGLEEGKIWVPTSVVAKDVETIIESAGTKYTSSPTMVGLKKAVKDMGLGKVAVVGTACQMRGLSNMTQGRFKNKKYGDAVQLKVGLFCMETFEHGNLIAYLKEKGVDPSEVTKFEIKNGRFYAKKGDDVVHKAKLSKVKDLVRPCCHSCNDFTSEFADISVGNVGSPDGWSTVIVRTERGEKALKSTVDAGLIELQPMEGFEEGESLVHRLSKMKKENALHE